MSDKSGNIFTKALSYLNPTQHLREGAATAIKTLLFLPASTMMLQPPTPQDTISEIKTSNALNEMARPNTHFQQFIKEKGFSLPAGVAVSGGVETTAPQSATSVPRARGSNQIG